MTEAIQSLATQDTVAVNDEQKLAKKIKNFIYDPS